MSSYTLQNNIDHLGLGDRWGCTFTGPINVLEHIIGRKVTEEELDEIIGHFFRRGFADMSNYVDHANLKKKAKDCTSWDAEDNPEWHYLVNSKRRMSIIRYLEFRFRTRIPIDLFSVALMRTQYGTIHYCIMVNTGKLINPDPSLKGPIIEKRPLIYGE